MTLKGPDTLDKSDRLFMFAVGVSIVTVPPLFKETWVSFFRKLVDSSTYQTLDNSDLGPSGRRLRGRWVPVLETVPHLRAVIGDGPSTV